MILNEYPCNFEEKCVYVFLQNLTELFQRVTGNDFLINIVNSFSQIIAV